LTTSELRVVAPGPIGLRRSNKKNMHKRDYESFRKGHKLSIRKTLRWSRENIAVQFARNEDTKGHIDGKRGNRMG